MRNPYGYAEVIYMSPVTESLKRALADIDAEIARLEKLKRSISDQIRQYESGAATSSHREPTVAGLSPRDLAGQSLSQAVRSIAMIDGTFIPSRARPVLVAAGILEDTEDAPNRLNKHLHSMPEMQHVRRNLWRLVGHPRYTKEDMVDSAAPVQRLRSAKRNALAHEPQEKYGETFPDREVGIERRRYLTSHQLGRPPLPGTYGAHRTPIDRQG